MDAFESFRPSRIRPTFTNRAWGSRKTYSDVKCRDGIMPCEIRARLPERKSGPPAGHLIYFDANILLCQQHLSLTRGGPAELGFRAKGEGALAFARKHSYGAPHSSVTPATHERGLPDVHLAISRFRRTTL